MTRRRDSLAAELDRMEAADPKLRALGQEVERRGAELLYQAAKVERALREYDSGHGVGRHRVKDTGGVNIGWATWRGELDRWEVDDDRHHLPGHRPTFGAAVVLVRKRVRCDDREEAKRCR